VNLFDLIALLVVLVVIAALIGFSVYVVAKNPSSSKPWWAPDARGFVIASVLVIAAITLFYRMTHLSTADDKVLDMMLTILFSTALVAIINFLFGSSRNADNKDDTINKIALMPAPSTGSAAPTDQPTPPSPPAAS
jgi:hypothetical protein